MKKISIKREQSQAGLSFAERENRRSAAGGKAKFRPQVKNKLLLLLALLMTAATGAWAAKYTKAVAISELKVGDILALGASITGESSDKVYLDPNRSKKAGNDVVGTEVGLNLTVSFGTNGTINNQYAPVTESGQDGDAWVVTKVVNQFDIYTVNLAGILMGGGTEPVAGTYSVALASGTEDASQWQAKVGDGEFKVLPVTGLEGETVTIQYNGTRRVKSITAVQTAAAEEQQEEAVTTATPLTMECLTDGTIVVNIYGTLSSGMQYAVNGGEKTKITGTTTIDGLKTGDKVQFYGVGTSTQDYGNDVEVNIAGGTAQVKVYGNIMSLLDETGFATKTDLPSSDYVFYGLFYDNDKLTDASGLLLPATTLASNCYNSMFADCTSLTAAPALPAPTLAESCYESMFGGCTALTAAPELPATTLVNSCYNQMFYYCSKLASVTCKATNISAQLCLSNWLRDAGTDESVTSRTLYVDPTMTSNTGWNNGSFIITAIQQ